MSTYATFGFIALILGVVVALEFWLRSLSKRALQIQAGLKEFGDFNDTATLDPERAKAEDNLNRILDLESRWIEDDARAGRRKHANPWAFKQ